MRHVYLLLGAETCRHHHHASAASLLEPLLCEPSTSAAAKTTIPPKYKQAIKTYLDERNGNKNLVVRESTAATSPEKEKKFSEEKKSTESTFVLIQTL